MQRTHLVITEPRQQCASVRRRKGGCAAAERRYDAQRIPSGQHSQHEDIRTIADIREMEILMHLRTEKNVFAWGQRPSEE